MFSPLPFWLLAASLVDMFNSTIYGAARWTLPRYFEYDIVNGPAGTSVEWIRVYVPGPWQPVAENTLGPAPEDPTTYREWRKVYHFDVQYGLCFPAGLICVLLYMAVS